MGLREDRTEYPGTHHAFFNDTPRSHDAEAAALAWERTIAFPREDRR